MHQEFKVKRLVRKVLRRTIHRHISRWHKVARSLPDLDQFKIENLMKANAPRDRAV